MARFRHRRQCRDLYDTKGKYRPNPRSSRGAVSTPEKQRLVEKFSAALPPTCYTTIDMTPRQLVDDILAAAGCAPADLSVMHIRHMDVITAALQYAALYQRHVVGNRSLSLDVPCMYTVRSRPGVHQNDLSREAANSSLTPVLQLAETVSVVEWPPPPSLTSAALAGYVYKTASESFLNEQKASSGEEEESEQETASTEETAVIFVAPYVLETTDVEDPRKNSLILATVGPHDALVQCAGDLLDWYNERAKTDDPEESHFGLYRLKEASWIHEEDRRARTVESVFLPEKQRDDLVEDARRFFSAKTREWYHHHGVPFRRSYLFHGPPGTGKTSMIKALASDLQRNSCFLSMTHMLEPEAVADAIADLPPRPLIVIEDVDALFTTQSQVKMSFSALLNILDGIMSAEGVLTIMTTNHVTRIDPIAIRAGRVDRLFFFGPASDDVLRQCFRYFYKDAAEETVERFVSVLQKEHDVKARSIATLQEHFIEMREESAEECVDKLAEFVKNYVNRASLLKKMEDEFKEETGTNGAPFVLDGEKVNKYAESEENGQRPDMYM